MGAKKSKTSSFESSLQTTHIKTCRKCFLQIEDLKRVYQDEYRSLEQAKRLLQNKYNDLEMKLQLDKADSEDNANRITELSHKLSEALRERDLVKSEYQTQVAFLELREHDTQIKLQDDAKKKLEEMKKSYIEKIEKLESDKRMLSSLNCDKDAELNKYKGDNEVLRIRFEADKKKLAEEKNELDKQWESKLSEEIKGFSKELTKIRASSNQEKLTLQEELNKISTELTFYRKKYKVANHLLQDMRARYDLRESRKEDLEKIADLEGQLVVQLEEIERQRDILKSLNISDQQIGVGKRHRNRKNSRKRANKANKSASGSFEASQA